MLFRLKFLSFFIIIALTVLYKVHTKQIDIVRGEQDLFTNPKCSDGNNQVRCTNCEGLNAVCANKNCSSCRCIGNNTTFVSMREKYGQCVENEYLLYLTSYNSSFLVQEKNNKKCLYHSKPSESKFTFARITDSCNYRTSSQRWIWNRNGQLINTDTLECLEEGLIQRRGNYHYFVLLKKCNLNEKKQLWRCEGEGSYFFSQQSSGRYMDYRNFYIYITSYSKISTASQWTRLGTNQQSICSQAVGCERFIDGSAMIILDKTKKKEIVKKTEKENRKSNVLNIGEKEIALNNKSNNCSILQEQTQYLHQDVWKPLSLKGNIFNIFTSKGKTFLKWNLDKAPDWTGIVIKLQFHCKTRSIQSIQQEKLCILIKFKGTFHGAAGPLGFPTPTTRQTSRDSQSSKTIIIIVCIILAVMAIGAGIGLMFYKRKNRRQDQRTCSNETTNRDTQSQIHVLAGATANGNNFPPTTDVGIQSHDAENTSESTYVVPASSYQSQILAGATDNGNNSSSPNTDVGIQSHDAENTSEATYVVPASSYQSQILAGATENGNNSSSPATDVGIQSHDAENTWEATYVVPASSYQSQILAGATDNGNNSSSPTTDVAKTIQVIQSASNGYIIHVKFIFKSLLYIIYILEIHERNNPSPTLIICM